MSYALDSDSFINAFVRMVSRREIYVVSDNETNFVGAEREKRGLNENLWTEKRSCVRPLSTDRLRGNSTRHRHRLSP